MKSEKTHVSVWKRPFLFSARHLYTFRQCACERALNSNTYNNMKTISLFFIISLLSLLINGAVTESVTMSEGYSLTLHTNTVIQSDDVIEWRCGDELIAKLWPVLQSRSRFLSWPLDRGSTSVFNGSDGRFSDRLKINYQTGDLTIIDFTNDLAGLYHQITGEKTGEKTFNVSYQYGLDKVTSFSVMEGDSVILKAGARDKMTYDLICWRFGNLPLAEIDIETEIMSTHDDVHGERFRDRLKLDDRYGSLTITNITTDHSGLYGLDVDSNSGTHTIQQMFTVTVSDEVKSVSATVGDSVTLHTDLYLQRDDKVVWGFGPYEANIATTYRDNIMRAAQDDDIDRFFERLQSNDQTGSLTITSITTDYSRRYELYVYGRREYIRKRFIVIVSDADVSSAVKGGTCVGVLLVVAAACVWSQIL
ncbi:uncharacterized protein LOC130548433 [Triplophysa rosa]|uniref:uncharacterized protein LOC130548433 n=1 Tax=Triplophysa rosa TaxID=992332 RepID=UPI002545C352|nr:uncharacterized protein LOC130548433 [Triplophysa rosa]